MSSQRLVGSGSLSLSVYIANILSLSLFCSKITKKFASLIWIIKTTRSLN